MPVVKINMLDAWLLKHGCSATNQSINQSIKRERQKREVNPMTSSRRMSRDNVTYFFSSFVVSRGMTGKTVRSWVHFWRPTVIGTMLSVLSNCSRFLVQQHWKHDRQFCPCPTKGSMSHEHHSEKIEFEVCHEAEFFLSIYDVMFIFVQIIYLNTFSMMYLAVLQLKWIFVKLYLFVTCFLLWDNMAYMLPFVRHHTIIQQLISSVLGCIECTFYMPQTIFCVTNQHTTISTNLNYVCHPYYKF